MTWDGGMSERGKTLCRSSETMSTFVHEPLNGLKRYLQRMRARRVPFGSYGSVLGSLSVGKSRFRSRPHETAVT